MSNLDDLCLPPTACHRLSDGNAVYHIPVRDSVSSGPEGFETQWQLHPAEYAEILIHGKPTKIPRWQQAYGRDYHFSGKKSNALPVPEIMQPFMNWACATVDPRLNGLLVNWYDASLGHYIGAHHDETRHLIPGSPIITISLGEQRIFRLTREEKRGGKKIVAETYDLEATNLSAIILPWATNLAWKHSVPKSARYTARRISITLRAFNDANI